MDALPADSVALERAPPVVRATLRRAFAEDDLSMVETLEELEQRAGQIQDEFAASMASTWSEQQLRRYRQHRQMLIERFQQAAHEAHQLGYGEEGASEHLHGARAAMIAADRQFFDEEGLDSEALRALRQDRAECLLAAALELLSPSRFAVEDAP
jgi:hypothetical protein